MFEKFVIKFNSGAIDKNAIKAINHLIKHQYQAYLVGGCVRDLLLDEKPKDFDIVTNATPEQVHKIFKHSRIIGRRFRLVHILFGRYDYLEVATFRSGMVSASEKNIKIGNKLYGNIDQDARRRDFSINALYYDIKQNCVLDYVGGLADIKHKKLTMIGDEVLRYQEDPVRLLRAIRFGVKFNFILEKTQQQHIKKFAHLLAGIPSARLYEEVVKLFHNECAVQTLEALVQYDLFKYLFPKTHITPFVVQALTNTQHRIATQQRVSASFFIAVFLWQEIQTRYQKHSQTKKFDAPLFFKIAQQVLLTQIQTTSFAKYISKQIIDIWFLQYKLLSVDKKRLQATLAHPRFRAAYDFFHLREKSGEQELMKLLNFWTKQQNISK